MERYQGLLIPGNPELLTFPFWARLESWGIQVRIWRQLWNKWEQTQERLNWRGNVGSAPEEFSAGGGEIFTVMDHDRATISSGQDDIPVTAQWQIFSNYTMSSAWVVQLIECTWVCMDKKGSKYSISISWVLEAKDAPESWKIVGLVFKKWQVGWFLQLSACWFHAEGRRKSK